MSGEFAHPDRTGRTDPDAPEVQPELGVEAPITPTAPPVALTRAGAAWVATGVSLLLLILLIVFILQNSDSVRVNYLGWSGSLSLGVALLIAAVTGGVLVAIAGVARITQLRRIAKRRGEAGTRA